MPSLPADSQSESSQPVREARERKVDKDQASDLIEISRKHFLSTGDRESRVWMFVAEEPSAFDRSSPPPAFLDSSVHFGPAQFGIHIVRQFTGRLPILLNYEAFTSEVHIPFRPTAIMDSNVVNYLHRYVTSKSDLEPQRREAVVDFLWLDRVPPRESVFRGLRAGCASLYAASLTRALTVYTSEESRSREHPP